LLNKDNNKFLPTHDRASGRNLNQISGTHPRAIDKKNIRDQTVPQSKSDLRLGESIPAKFVEVVVKNFNPVN
jgi:surfactin synthase thioesterase subunit